MNDAISRFFDGFFTSAARTLREHPVEVLLGVALAGLITLMEMGAISHYWEYADPIVMTVPLVFPAVLAVSVLHRMEAISKMRRVGLTLVILALGVFYIFWFGSQEGDAEFWRWWMLSVVAVSALTLTPLAATEFSVPRAVRFWRFNARLAAKAFVTGLYVVLSFIGIALGFFAIEALFEVSMAAMFIYLAAWWFCVVGPWMFLSGVSDMVELHREVPEAAIRWIARLGSFLVLPLIALYLAITYAYSAGVLFTDFAPSNVISPLILGAGILGFLGLYLVEPLRHREGYDVLSKLYQGFPAAFLAVLPLSFWAVLVRIGQYGWTEFRYARLLAIFLFALVCVYGTVQLLRSRPMRLHVVPMAAAAGCFFAAAGPGNIVDVSKSSQLDRIERMAEDGELFDDAGTFSPDDIGRLSEEDQEMMADAVRYMRRQHGDDVIEHLVPEDMTNNEWGTGAVQYRWSHHRRSADDGALGYESTVRFRTGPPWRFDEPGTLYELSYLEGRPQNRIEIHEGRTLSIDFDDTDVEMEAEWYLQEFVLTADAEPLFKLGEEHIDGDRMRRDLPADRAELTLHNDEGGEVGAVFVEEIRFAGSSEMLSVTRLDGYLYLYEPRQ